jgi:Uma2 family endonuclease
MSSAIRKPDKMTEAEFFEWERQQPDKHEFYNGEVFMQAGGTRNHSLIASNVNGEIRSFLRENECQVYGSDMRIHIEATGYQAYPDVSVACPPITGESDDVISNPVLVVEVLSPSTADFDRGGKFGHYRQIPSLREYLVISQDEARVEQHQRTNDGMWLLREVTGLDQTLQLVSIDRPLPLSEVYAKIDFE